MQESTHLFLHCDSREGVEAEQVGAEGSTLLPLESSSQVGCAPCEDSKLLAMHWGLSIPGSCCNTAAVAGRSAVRTSQCPAHVGCTGLCSPNRWATARVGSMLASSTALSSSMKSLYVVLCGSRGFCVQQGCSQQVRLLQQFFYRPVLAPEQPVGSSAAPTPPAVGSLRST